jgi:hypothetical protein
LLTAMPGSVVRANMICWPSSVHGVFAPYHILVSEGRIYVLDLESSRAGYPYEDLALFQADADGWSVDGRNRDLRQVFEFAHGALQNFVAQVVEKMFGDLFIGAGDAHRAFEGAEHIAFGLQIATGAKAASSAGQNHDSDDGVARDLIA